MRRRAIAVVAATLASASLAAAPSAAHEVVTRSYVVETKAGRIAVEVAHERDVNGPVLLTYTPYSDLYVAADGSRTGDDRSLAWIEQGYTRVVADVLGTGNSGGCWDYGGPRERSAGRAIVEWAARQRWSNGDVAMVGGSYDGTAAIAVATTDPPHLDAVVTENALVRWYDYAYSGGIRYFLSNEALAHQGPDAAAGEGFHTPLAFDFGVAVPPPLDVASPDWAERTSSTVRPCGEIRHTEHGYDDTPDYDGFWRSRDYLRAAGRIDVPVLIGHSWGDWNVKQHAAIDLYRALDNSPDARLFMASRWQGHDRPGGGYEGAVDGWLAHHLKGAPAPDVARVTSRMADSEGARAWYRGGWPRTRRVTLVAQWVPPTKPGDYPWQLRPGRPHEGLAGAPAEAAFASAGINTEGHANHHARTNHDWFWFESPELTRDVRIFGEVEVQIYSSVDRRWVTYTPTIVDVDPEDHETIAGNHVGADPKALVSVTRGWLDSRYRKDLGRRVPLSPGERFEMTVVTKPQDYTFREGHLIGLNIATEINEWSLPKPYPCETPDCAFVRVDWLAGRTKVILPVVGVDGAADLFEHHGHHHP